MGKFDAFKTKEITEPTDMEMKLTSLVAKRDKEILLLEEILVEKNKVIKN